ncbi:MAG TPA: hypothetical protein PLM24_07600 [Methanothrix sp.]|nr:hypothetical protein [Methanothrix sp.]
MVLVMKRIIFVLIAVAVMALFCGAVVEADADGDENYHDHSEEHSDGPGEPPEDGQAREELRTRAKD